MSGINNKYQKTTVKGNEFLKDTENIYRLVSQRPWFDKKGILGEGVIVVGQIIKDNSKYPEGKDNMILENFEAYIICGSQDIGLKKGDYFSLDGFIEEHSYYINYNYILRFRGIKKIDIKENNKE